MRLTTTVINSLSEDTKIDFAKTLFDDLTGEEKLKYFDEEELLQALIEKDPEKVAKLSTEYLNKKREDEAKEKADKTNYNRKQFYKLFKDEKFRGDWFHTPDFQMRLDWDKFVFYYNDNGPIWVPLYKPIVDSILNKNWDQVYNYLRKKLYSQ